MIEDRHLNIQLGHYNQILLQCSLSIIADETFFLKLGNRRRFNPRSLSINKLANHSNSIIAIAHN